MIFDDKNLVDKNASGSRIDKGSHRESLEGVCSFKSNRKILRGPIGIIITDSKL